MTSESFTGFCSVSNSSALKRLLGSLESARSKETKLILNVQYDKHTLKNETENAQCRLWQETELES